MFIAGIEIFFGFVAGAILLTVGVMIAGMLWAIVCATTFTLTRALLQKIAKFCERNIQWIAAGISYLPKAPREGRAGRQTSDEPHAKRQ